MNTRARINVETNNCMHKNCTVNKKLRPVCGKQPSRPWVISRFEWEGHYRVRCAGFVQAKNESESITKQ
jgi:hypothetical protein